VSPIRATLWDLGGVLFTSPFEAFARYERAHGLPEGFIRRLNATNPDTNAWARLERGEVDLAAFVALFEAEARAAGGSLDGWEVLGLLRGEVRPEAVKNPLRLRSPQAEGIFRSGEDSPPLRW
jgi:putative hydrolase of the HAD superfamily